jgi:threonyl-tRNA synthetase
VREHSLAKIPLLIALGRKEASENTISLRRLGSNAQTTMGVEEALQTMVMEGVPPDLRG